MRPSRHPSRLLAALTLPVVVAIAVSGCSATASTGTGTGAAGATSTPDTGTHLVEHARGETEVPNDVQRVVVLEPVQLDTTVALGLIPVGAAVLNEAAGVPAYLGAAAAGIATVGTVPEPSIEKIAALKPDLILGTESRHSALYDQLSSIAPTVFMASQADPWTDNVALVARALGDEAGADDLLTAYTDRCAEIAETYGVAGMTAQFVRPRDGILTLYGPTSFAGSTLECAGFTIPERDWEGSISVDISPERVLDAQADLVLVSATDVTDPTLVPESIRTNAASFPGLNVVDQSFWITGVGPLGGMTVLDDIERILAGTK
ncbi:ABC transporter substrate-binding protein [Cryobacterium arcticum]|uniref:Fe3+-hydroxamate ABC transporter periplasmic protein n=1 Tax=Cryobacterium arcticum TaxID=670052 RepID=A0A1B1BL46_9MICO|nr:iron-siderophore ABC transporter substrate-binding protein [Cryobacterium arcticum]ANP73258.1 Fe3+-hydroxamate ABC transporter periplasmic protein [Cryobacterium arcticum]